MKNRNTLYILNLVRETESNPADTVLSTTRTVHPAMKTGYMILMMCECSDRSTGQLPLESFIAAAASYEIGVGCSVTSSSVIETSLLHGQ